MHDLLYSRNHASLPRADCPCPYPPPHQLPCHPLSRPYTTLTTRGSIRPFLEPTAPNPHAPLHRGDYHKAPCQHALMPSLLPSRLSCTMHPPTPPRQLPSCPVRLSQHHSPLPRGNCPDPPHQHLLMPLRHPDALPTCPAPSLAAPCAPAFPGQPHQRLSQPPTSARSPRLSGQLSYTTHPQMAARSAPQLPRSSLTAPRALASS